MGDHALLTLALLAFVDLETLVHLRADDQVTSARLKSAWADLLRRVTAADER